MLKITTLALFFSLAAPFAAVAGTAEDIQRIRPLLPAGRDIAQIQAVLITGGTEAEAFEVGKANYLIRDINGDGIEDILVISEESPTITPIGEEPAEKCAQWDPAHCLVEHHDRSLMFFEGKNGGSFNLVFSNAEMVLTGEDGGIWGDPLLGFTVTEKGTIRLSVYGGSNWRWGFTDVMLFRNGELYLVGVDSEDGFVGDGRRHTKSVNLLTGDVVETNQRHGNARVHTKRYKVAVKPLVRIATYKGQME